MRVSADGDAWNRRPSSTSRPTMSRIAGRHFFRTACTFCTRAIGTGFAARRLSRQHCGTRGAGPRLLAGDSGAIFVAPAGSDVGMLLTVRSSRVEARPFDALYVTFRRRGHYVRAASRRHVGRFPALFGASADVLAVGGHADSVWRPACRHVHDRRAPPGFPVARSPGFRVSPRTAGGWRDRRWTRYAAIRMFGSRIWIVIPSCA